MCVSYTRRLPGRIAGVLFGFAALVILGGSGCAPTSYVSYPPAEAEVSDYDYLAEYGEWIEFPNYGLVWSPYVVAGWAPFYHGHWSWTDDGWAWISYEPFGWLVYHYGYWNFDRSVGWFWVPGTTWSPARVEWYTFDSYCGWAPLPPPNVYWPEPWDSYDTDVWIVVDINDFPNDNVGRHRIKEPLHRDTIRREVIVKRPPTIEHVENVTQRILPVVKIDRQPADIRPEVIKNPPKANRPREITIRRMVLPEPEQTKVDEHAAEVKREVLTPRKTDTPDKKEKAEPAKDSKEKQEQSGEEKKQGDTKQKQQPEKKTDDTQKQKVRKR